MTERDELRLRHILDAAERISTYLQGVVRNRLVHGYFDVDLRVVWQTAKYSVPPFVQQITALLETGKQGDR